MLQFITISQLFSKIRRFFGKADFRLEKGYYFKIDLNNLNYESGDGVVEIRLAASLEEVRTIILERGPSYLRRYERWMKNGHYCYYAISGGEVIGLVWIHSSQFVDILFGRRAKVNDTKTEAWVIDAYMLEAYRGSGIYRFLWYQALYSAKERGYKYIHAIIQDSNIKSFKVHYQLGCNSNVYKIIYYLRFMWFDLYCFRRFKVFRDILELKKSLKGVIRTREG